MRVAVYTGSRNLYKYMIGPIKSMLMNGKPDRVYLLIEDDTFPVDLPEQCIVINCSDQQFFKKDGVNMRSKFTYLAMMRAALAKVLPTDIDRVLSMDCDTIVVGDITELWERSIDGYYFSATLEPARTRWDEFYTNIGVCIYNLKMLRETGMVDKVIDELNKNEHRYLEQDVFNMMCRGHILPMPSEYNYNDFVNKPYRPIAIKHFAGPAFGANTWGNLPEVVFYAKKPWDEVLNG